MEIYPFCIALKWNHLGLMLPLLFIHSCNQEARCQTWIKVTSIFVFPAAERMDSCWCQQNTLANSVTALLTNRKSYSLWHRWSTYFYHAPLLMEPAITYTPHAINLGRIQNYPNALAMKMTIASSGDKDEADTTMQMFWSLICSSFSEVSSAVEDGGVGVMCVFQRGCRTSTIHFLWMDISCCQRSSGVEGREGTAPIKHLSCSRLVSKNACNMQGTKEHALVNSFLCKSTGRLNLPHWLYHE